MAHSKKASCGRARVASPEEPSPLRSSKSDPVCSSGALGAVGADSTGKGTLQCTGKANTKQIS